MSKQLFIQSGVFPELSFAELLSVLSSFGLQRECITRYGKNIFLLNIDEKITPQLARIIFLRLGGTIRLGEIIEDIDSFEMDTENDKKVTFGISILGEGRKTDSAILKKLANGIKKQLRENKISSRFVLPQHKDISLNAAQIIKNNILSEGFELVLIRNGDQEIYGKTLEIQDLEGFVGRDIKRPESNLQMGTLPPKLARIMVNLTGLKNGVIWDPFCGSGTLLMEAAVLGFDFLASDIDPRAVMDTENNIKWLLGEGQITENTYYNAFQFDILKPDQGVVNKLKHTDIDAIVCEPYMGPPQTKILSVEYANKLLEDVKRLYRKLFELIDEKLQKRGIKVVMILPSYKTDKGWRTFGIRELVGKRWNVKNTTLVQEDLKWMRKNSIITRNIFILERT